MRRVQGAVGGHQAYDHFHVPALPDRPLEAVPQQRGQGERSCSANVGWYELIGCINHRGHYGGHYTACTKRGVVLHVQRRVRVPNRRSTWQGGGGGTCWCTFATLCVCQTETIKKNDRTAIYYFLALLGAIVLTLFNSLFYHCNTNLYLVYA